MSEHALFRWGVKCPIFVARQWLRHRIGSFNEESLSYCVARREYYVPADEPMTDEYIRYTDARFDLYDKLVTAAGRMKERARAVLGTGMYTEFIWAVNAWSLMNWLPKRSDKAVRWEHRQYARATLRLHEGMMPATAVAFREFCLATSRQGTVPSNHASFVQIGVSDAGCGQVWAMESVWRPIATSISASIHGILCR